MKKHNFSQILTSQRMIWGIILFTLMFSMPVFAWSNNTFYNGVSYNRVGSMNFSGSQNILFNLTVPQNTFILNAFINISSFNDTVNAPSFDTPNTFVSAGAGGEKIKTKKAFTIFGFTKDSLTTATKCYLELGGREIIANGSFLGDYCVLNQSYNVSANTYYYLVVDKSGIGYSMSYNLTDASSYPFVTDYLNFTNFLGTDGVDYDNAVYMIKSIKINFSEVVNPSVSISSSIWSYGGKFHQANNMTNNFYSSINSYLAGCSYSGGFCQVPITFHSDTTGGLEYSGLYFNNEGLIENSQTYNAVTTEGNSETFSINITYDSNYHSNSVASLVYNGTYYTGTKTTVGNDVIFTRTIPIPQVTTLTNYSFFWNIEMINSTRTTYFNSTSHNQSVSNLGINDCDGGGVLILNYTMKDERTQLPINTSNYNATIEVDIQIYPVGSSTILLNLSKRYNNTNNANICFNSSILTTAQYSLYAQAKYYADGYFTRNNYIQNYSLTNTTATQHINLYDLLTTQGTKFFVTYKDENFLAVQDALINIKKKYVSEGVFKTVEIEKTDYLGQTSAYFDLTQATYSTSVTKNGQTLSTFDNIAIFCTDTLTGNCQLNLDAGASTSEVADFYNYHGLNYNRNFNATSRIYTLIFDTVNSLPALVSINLTKFDMNQNITLCSSQVSTSSGTLTCTVPGSYNNVTFYATIWKDGQIITTDIYVIKPKANDIWGGNIVTFVLGLVITLGIMMAPSAIFLIIGTLIGFGISAVLFLISGSLLQSGVFIMLVVAGVLIIVRIRNGGSE